MTPEDFAAWLDQMKADRGWSARKCRIMLGCGVNTVKTWREKGAPSYIAYACAALSLGLPPWRPVKNAP